MGSICGLLGSSHLSIRRFSAPLAAPFLISASTEETAAGNPLWPLEELHDLHKRTSDSLLDAIIASTPSGYFSSRSGVTIISRVLALGTGPET
jgi:hypothetical protein